MNSFIANLPKAELHVHLEGTLEPELSFALAKKNGIPLEYHPKQELLKAYDFHDLPSFLRIYYKAMNVLRTEDDFFELTWQYLSKAAATEGGVRGDVLRSAGAHVARCGVRYRDSRHPPRAGARGITQLGVETQLIMCFLRDMSAESAMETLLGVPALQEVDRRRGAGLGREGQSAGEVRRGVPQGA